MTELNKKLEIKAKDPNESLQQFSDGMLKLAIEGINEAVARERLKTAYWKRQAYILHSKLGQCRECSNKVAVKDADLYFEMGGADCLDCPAEDNKPLN